jgi:hypothetical protein
MKSVGTRIGEIVLGLVSLPHTVWFVILTCLTVPNDSNICQSLDLIMLLQLERDLLNPSINLSIMSPSSRQVRGASDGQAVLVRGGKVERLLQSYP